MIDSVKMSSFWSVKSASLRIMGIGNSRRNTCTELQQQVFIFKQIRARDLSDRNRRVEVKGM